MLIRKTLLLLAAVTVAAGCQGTGRHEAVADPRWHAPAEVHPFEGITVLRDQPAVEIEAWSCLESGWLEQIACSPNTREHESVRQPMLLSISWSISQESAQQQSNHGVFRKLCIEVLRSRIPIDVNRPGCDRFLHNPRAQERVRNRPQ